MQNYSSKLIYYTTSFVVEFGKNELIKLNYLCVYMYEMVLVVSYVIRLKM